MAGEESYVARPPQGSGPGVLLWGDLAALRSLADTLAGDGYVAMIAADGADVGAAVAALRAQPACKGRLGAIGYGVGSAPALRAAADRLVDCVVLYDPVDGPVAVEIPAITHRTGAAAPWAAATYLYSTARPGFIDPRDACYDQAAAGMAYSRTLALLRRELGPQFDLDALWEAHRACEFVTRDADATMRTMVAEPYVNHVPTMTGGFGQIDLHRFYRDHFIPNNPSDMRNIPISRTVGSDRVVNEGILCFTHDRQIDWLLPGIAPTGRYVEVALIGIITFRGDKLVHEHIYWDQASVLVQVGLLDPAGLPVAGAAAARKVMNPSLPSNELLPGWRA